MQNDRVCFDLMRNFFKKIDLKIIRFWIFLFSIFLTKFYLNSFDLPLETFNPFCILIGFSWIRNVVLLATFIPLILFFPLYYLYLTKTQLNQQEIELTTLPASGLAIFSRILMDDSLSIGLLSLLTIGVIVAAIPIGISIWRAKCRTSIFFYTLIVFIQTSLIVEFANEFHFAWLSVLLLSPYIYLKLKKFQSLYRLYFSTFFTAAALLLVILNLKSMPEGINWSHLFFKSVAQPVKENKFGNFFADIKLNMTVCKKYIKPIIKDFVCRNSNHLKNTYIIWKMDRLEFRYKNLNFSLPSTDSVLVRMLHDKN